MKFRNHYTRRLATPSDRHKRVVSFRHNAYVAKNKKESFKVAEETVIVQATLKEDTSKVVRPEVKEIKEEPKIEVVPVRKLTKKEKKDNSRNAEAQAMLDHKKYSLLDLLIHPSDCMENEAEEEIPASFLSSLFRLLVKWAIFSLFLGICFRDSVNKEGFSFLYLNFTSTAGIVFGLTLLFMLCEISSYLLTWIVCVIKRKGISLTRIFAVGSMNALFMSVLFVISGALCLYHFSYGFLLALIFMLVDIYLRQTSFSKCTECHKEMQGVLFALSFMVQGITLYYLFSLTMTKMIELITFLYQ